MSEYQYYEFVAIDKPLSQAQMSQLRALSTRADITPSSFVNEYHWGNFRGDPRTMMENYFDAHLYLANWGTHQVMFRLPKTQLDLETAQRYCVGDSAHAWSTKDHVILDLFSKDENGDFDDEADGALASIVQVRAELTSGDLRGLYLAWLASVQVSELDDDEAEPPVPHGLDQLSAAQHRLAGFLRVDEHLLDAAAAASPPLSTHTASTSALKHWIVSLPATDKDIALLRLMQGDIHVRAELLRRHHGQPLSTAEPRTVAQLLEAAEVRRAHHQRDADRNQTADRTRAERIAAAAREERLQDLATREGEVWCEIDALIDTKRPGEYDRAVDLLCDLRVLSQHNSDDGFTHQLDGLRQRHARKPSLIERLNRVGLTS